MNIEQYLNDYEVENMWVEKKRSFLKEYLKKKTDFPHFEKRDSVNEEYHQAKIIFSLPLESARDGLNFRQSCKRRRTDETFDPKVMDGCENFFSLSSFIKNEFLFFFEVKQVNFGKIWIAAAGLADDASSGSSF